MLALFPFGIPGNLPPVNSKLGLTVFSDANKDA